MPEYGLEAGDAAGGLLPWSWAVWLEGVAERVGDASLLTRLRVVYEAKYGSGYPPDSGVWAVRPVVVLGFIERAEAFAATATRWSFAGRS
jgi:hypothetical protein